MTWAFQMYWWHYRYTTHFQWWCMHFNKQHITRGTTIAVGHARRRVAALSAKMTFQTACCFEDACARSVPVFLCTCTWLDEQLFDWTSVRIQSWVVWLGIVQIFLLTFKPSNGERSSWGNDQCHWTAHIYVMYMVPMLSPLACMTCILCVPAYGRECV